MLGLLFLTLLTALPPLLLVPPTVKPDETYHWAYATYVATTGSLPPYLSPDDPASRESQQPPLYYSLAAWLSRKFADPNAFEDRIANPFFMVTERGNRNHDILGPGAARLFWIGRGLSLAFWLLVPLLAFWVWQPILGMWGSLTAATLVALIPIMAFMGTSYSNDMPSVAFMAIALGAALRVLDPERTPSRRWYLLLGLSLGLSMLSKLYALPLMGAIGLIAVAPMLKLDARRRWQLLGALALAVVMLIPWLLENYRRFHDPLAMSVFSEIMGHDPAWFRPAKVYRVAVQAWRTFWGDQGPGGVDAIPGWLAIGLGVLEAAALAGIWRWLRRVHWAGRYRNITVLLMLWVALALVSFVWTFLRTSVTVIAGGRNLLYLQLINAPILVIGLQEWDRSLFGQRVVRVLLVATGLVMTVWAWVCVVDIYPVPQRTALSEQGAAPIARFGEQYALLDWHVRPSADHIDVEFALAKIGPDDRSHAYFIQLVTPGGELLANVNTYPAYGVLSTGYLPQGTVLHESYELSTVAPVPAGSRVLLGLWTPPTAEDRLPAFDAAGHPLLDSAYAALWSAP